MLRELRCHRLFGDVDHQVTFLAVLDELGRNMLTDEVHQEADGRHPHLAFPRKAQALRHAFAVLRVQAGARMQPVQRRQDEVGVAVNVGTHLHHRRAAVATGERAEQRAWRQASDLN